MLLLKQKPSCLPRVVPQAVIGAWMLQDPQEQGGKERLGQLIWALLYNFLSLLCFWIYKNCELFVLVHSMDHVYCGNVLDVRVSA